jgi:bacterioferritin (cytochrome b1)
MGTIKDLVNGLQDSLSKEYAAKMQYDIHAQVVTDWYFAFSEELKAHAAEESAHAIKLIELIIYLGYEPTVKTLEIKIPEANEEIIKANLDTENAAIELYNSLIKQANELGIYEAVTVLQSIIIEEMDHKNFLLSILGE